MGDADEEEEHMDEERTTRITKFLRITTDLPVLARMFNCSNLNQFT